MPTGCATMSPCAGRWASLIYCSSPARNRATRICGSRWRREAPRCIFESSNTRLQETCDGPKDVRKEEEGEGARSIEHLPWYVAESCCLSFSSESLPLH